MRCEKELFLCIEDKGWRHIEIQPIISSEFSLETFDELNTVVGSSVTGKAETHMQLIRWCIYSRILTLDEQRQLKEEFTKDFTTANFLLQPSACLFAGTRPRRARDLSRHIFKDDFSRAASRLYGCAARSD